MDNVTTEKVMPSKNNDANSCLKNHVNTVNGEEGVNPDFKNYEQNVIQENNHKVISCIWKNILVLAFGIFLYQTSLGGLIPLQSSLHRDSGMGTITFSIRMACYGIGTLFLSNIFVKMFGSKWTMSLCMLSLPLWIVANGVGIWETMVPASIINGLLTGPIWAAEGSYINELTKIYIQFSQKKDKDRIVTIVFTIMNIALAGSNAFGSIVSNTVLKQDPPDNIQEPDPDDVIEYCGINGCPDVPITSGNNTYVTEPSNEIVWILIGVYFVICTVAITLMMVCLDTVAYIKMNLTGPLEKSCDEKNHSNKHSFCCCSKNNISKFNKTEVCRETLSVFGLMRHYRIWLLAPLNVAATMWGSYLGADFNYSWITCTMGIWMIGIVTLPNTLLSVPSILLTGFLAKTKRNRIPLMVFAWCAVSTTHFVLLFWELNTEQRYMLYVISIIAGIYSSVTICIMESVVAIGFPNDAVAAFACYNFYYTVGSSVSYGYNYFLCNDVKLYLVMCMLAIGFISYFTFEYVLFKENLGNSAVVDTIKEDDREFCCENHEFQSTSDDSDKLSIRL